MLTFCHYTGLDYPWHTAKHDTDMIDTMLLSCLALKKVDTKVNENEDKKSEDTEWQEKDKP